MPDIGFDALPHYTADLSSGAASATWLPIKCSADLSLDMSATEVDRSTRLQRNEAIALALQATGITMTVREVANMEAAAQAAFDQLITTATTAGATLGMWFPDNGDNSGSQGPAGNFVVHFSRDTPLNGGQDYSFTIRLHDSYEWYEKA